MLESWRKTSASEPGCSGEARSLPQSPCCRSPLVRCHTTIFSIASALLLRPRPGRRLGPAGRRRRTQRGRGFDTTSYPNYAICAAGSPRSRASTPSGSSQAMSLSENGQAERVYGTVATANFFEVSGPGRIEAVSFATTTTRARTRSCDQ